jgi:hypothetical protein
MSSIEGAFPLTPTAPIFSQNKKLWGRRWRVTIKSLQAIQPQQQINTPGIAALNYVEVLTLEQKGWLPEGLHITFDTTQTILQAMWMCDVVIYNLNAQQSQTVINYGMTLTLEAGYQDGAFGTIFEGTIFQPMWEKERGVDWKLTLRCIVGPIEVGDNFIGRTVVGGRTQRQLAAEMVGGATTPITLQMDRDIPNKTITRATTYFGQPNDLLQYIADTNNALLWFSHLTAHINQLRLDTTAPQWDIGPDNGLIGSPDQTQDGAVMQMLLKPDLVLLGQIKIKQGTVIRQMPREVGPHGTLPTILPSDNTYVIGRIRHYGDSRGNEWYTDVTGFVNAGEILGLKVQW